MNYKVRNPQVANLLSEADKLADDLVERGDIANESIVNRLIEQVRHLCRLYDEDTDLMASWKHRRGE